MKLKIPAWLKRDSLQLPDWAERVDTHLTNSGAAALAIEVDPNRAYREWADLLGVTQLDQYWLEVIYQCVKLDVQAALVGTPYDPRVASKPVEIIVKRASAWALRRFPKGRGAELATLGKEARAHYQRVRGRLPF